MSSIRNSKVALGGILGGAPNEPYPRLGGTVIIAF